MKRFRQNFREVAQYPSALMGLGIILILVVVAAYAVITIPYNEAIRLWRGGEDVWYQNPRIAAPAWYNLFSDTKLPESFVLSPQKGTATKSVEELPGGLLDITFVFPFDYQYDDFPQELIVYFKAQYNEKAPHVDMAWVTPDGREIRVGEVSPRRSESYRFSLDERLLRRLKGVLPQQALFADPTAESPIPLKGTYEMRVYGLVFEEGGDLDAEFVLHGKVHGLAGTDHRRRDLTVALLWGTPIALSFGLLAALGTTITTMILAAVSVWFGGVVGSLIQRVTQVNMILPTIPILVMVGTFYSRSIWLMLGIIIILSIFGSSILTYRAIFLQVKESPYIEAARAYGAGNMRIIFRYLVPRIIPMLVPQLVVLIPAFVFLEASLAVLGLGDPVLPTWGKLINDANTNGALHNAQYYWVLEPAILLMLTGLGFSMVGFALDRIFNPRLRGL